MTPEEAAQRKKLGRERKEVLQTIDNAASTLTPERQREFHERLVALVEKIRKVREAPGTYHRSYGVATSMPAMCRPSASPRLTLDHDQPPAPALTRHRDALGASGAPLDRFPHSRTTNVR